ncbi:MAG: hypothetical protein HN712_11655 [Gemmatimonadetes bacterium]|nr:hypothetical protein [Gemmatimonadota bacterium]MBT6145322.1 hypothetical protein [Gemmatimonadota bacterium]MBT7860964.1 hypothetical protein [Gemmatimonadota bacterium]
MVRMMIPAMVLLLSLIPVDAGDFDSGGGPVPRKLIQTGWDRPTPSVLLRNLAAREALPFQGMGITIIGVDDAGQPVPMRDAGTGRPWKRSWFQAQIDTLRQIHSEKLTDNFLYLDLSPPPEDFVDAFDDAGWKQIVDHLRIAAWIAKEGGLKGIMFDPEAYRGSVIKYQNRLHKDRSFAEYAAKVRERGRQCMVAMAQEYRDMTFFTLFMHSGIAMGAFGLDPRDGLESSGYSLYPAFINGWLDAVPPTLRIVDGFEMAYPHSSELQYLKHANAMRNASLALVAPENRAKYRAQVQTGLAIYLDAFVRYPAADVHADVWTDPPLTGPVQERLTAAVISAFEVVDEYVWVWCESYRWLRVSPHARGAQATWEEAMPGITEALRKATRPETRALERAAREFAIRQRKAALRGVPIRNLIANGDFNNGAAPSARPAVDRVWGKPATVQGGPEGWTTWNAAESAGEFGRATHGHSGFSSAQVVGAGDAAFTQRVNVAPFRFYRISAWIRSIGAGHADVRMRWLDEHGMVLTMEATPSPLTPEGPPTDGWQEVSGIVRCPQGALQLEVRLAVTDQEATTDVVWFDDVALYAIDVN